jgi:hypothetical protein
VASPTSNRQREGLLEIFFGIQAEFDEALEEFIGREAEEVAQTSGGFTRFRAVAKLLKETTKYSKPTNSCFRGFTIAG